MVLALIQRKFAMEKKIASMDLMNFQVIAGKKKKIRQLDARS